MKKIIFTGGSGRLGRAIKKLAPDFEYPSHQEFDVRDFDQMDGYVSRGEYRMIIHAAAIKSRKKVLDDLDTAIHTNISGSANVARICLKYGLRFIYLSTDYVFSGEKGNYKETDPLLPVDIYAWSKLGGECSAYVVPDHLVIRSSFGDPVFEHENAYIDQWTSRDSVEVIAPKILKAALSNVVGALHIGAERRTVYEYAMSLPSSRGRVFGKISRADSPFKMPKDISFNTDKYKKLFPEEDSENK